MKSVADDRKNCALIRRAIIRHLVRQSGGPTPDPRDALHLASHHYGLTIRQARIGRFTARICRLIDRSWTLDFNPDTPRLELVAAVWHELAELLCLSDDLLEFNGFTTEQYQESARSAYDHRHLCATGVERFVRAKLRQFPDVRAQLRADQVRRVLLARNSIVPSEPLLPAITREPWFDDEFQQNGMMPSV